MDRNIRLENAPAGFIGLGAMGRGMATNLVKNGVDLLCYARSEEKAREYRADGFTVTLNREDFSACRVIFLCLPDETAVEQVLFGAPEPPASPGQPGSPLRSTSPVQPGAPPQSTSPVQPGAPPQSTSPVQPGAPPQVKIPLPLAARLAPGTIVCDHSTIRYQSAISIHDRLLREYGIRYLDAPVSGMPARAAAGTLTIMCGGEEATFDDLLPFLRMTGKDVLYMGGPGSGQLTKLVNQLLYDINMAALAEILPMAVKLGLDPGKLTQVVNTGTGRSSASEFFLPRTLEGSFSDGYATKLAYKDLKSAFDITAGLGIPMPLFSAAASIYQQAILKGYGDEAKNSMFHVYEELLGVEFRKK